MVKGSGPAVYYRVEGNRYAFPNERIFFSWYQDFDAVSEISDAALAKTPLKGNITYRPGTRLVKLTTDPKVYAVECGGVLRWVKTEEMALDLYGYDWAERVDDLPDVSFPNYLIGDPIESALHPDGTVIAFDDHDAPFVVWQGLLREISGNAFSDNAFNEDDVIQLNRSYKTYSTYFGPDLTVAEAAFTDPAELNGVGRQEDEVEVGRASIATPILIQDGDDTLAFGFLLKLREERTLEQISLRVRALDNADSDLDAGGLINSPGQTSNLSDFKVIDALGNVVLDGANLALNSSKDGSQTLILTGEREFGPGQHGLFVTFDVDVDAPIDEQFALTLESSETELDGQALGDTFANIESRTLTVASGALTIELGSGAQSQFFTPGARTVEAAAFDFKMTGAEAVAITELTLTGYIDEGEGDDDFGQGIDEDDGGFTALDNVIDSVELLDENGDQLRAVTEIPDDGKIIFSNLSIIVDPGEEVGVIVRATVSASAPFELGADRFAFDIEDPENEIVVTDPDLEFEGANVNGGSSPSVVIKIAEHGALSLKTTSSSGRIVVAFEQNITISTLTFEADEVEDFVITKLSFQNDDNSSYRDIASYSLTYTDESGARATATKVVQSNSVTFEDLNIFVPEDDETDVYFRLTLDSSVASGDEIKYRFDADGPFAAIGLDSGEVFDDLAEDVEATLDSGETMIMRKNKPIIAASEYEIPEGIEIGVEDAFAFDLRRQGEGMSKITTLTFKVEPSDVGYELYDGSTDDDLLEYWADVNGDSAHDDDIVSLREEESGEEVGEGGSGEIHFAIYDASLKTIDTTPAGLLSERGDYGIITYTLPDPIDVGATAKTYVLELDLRGFAYVGGSLKVTLLGGADFIWNDGTILGEEDGSAAEGVPFRSQTLSVSP